MSESDDRTDRREFLLRLARSVAVVAAGATVLGGGCKCDEDEPDWSDKPESGDTQAQPGQDQQAENPPPEGDEAKKKKAGKSE